MLQPLLSSFLNGVILYSINVTFDFMIHYVKGVSSNIEESAKENRMDLGTYNAEIWFGNRFWVATKKHAAIFEILIFRDFSGGQRSNFATLTKF